MRMLIWLLLLAASAAGVSLLAQQNEGYALIVLAPWRIELSFNLFCVIVLGVFILGYFLVRGAAALLALPVSVREYRARNARDQADSSLREAVLMLMEGRFVRALHLAEASYESKHASYLSALVALQAAHGMRDVERVQRWRERAQLHEEKKNGGARLMVEAGIATESRDFDSARELLEEFARKDGRHVAAQRFALRVYQGLGRWHDVAQVVRQLEKHRAMTPQQAAPIRQRAQRHMLAELQYRDDAGTEIQRFLRKLPDADRLEPRLVLDAVPLLIKANNHAEAAQLIESALELRWDSDLAALYGNCGGTSSEVMKHIAHAERWLHKHPRDAKLLLALGRLCRRQQLWGKAQSFLEASLATQPTRWAHLELASLFDFLGQPEKANSHYRAAAGEFM